MGHVAVVLDAVSPLGHALCENLLDRGWTVFGGIDAASPARGERFHALVMDPQSLDSIEAAARTVMHTVDHVDLLIGNSDRFRADSFETLDFASIEQLYDTNAAGPIRFLEQFLPLTHTGLKRLCFITDAQGSVGLASHQDNFAYSMSKTALHMSVMILFNHLSRDGYTFRLFIPAVAPDLAVSARATCDYFIADRDDEGRLTIADALGEEWPF